WLSSPATRAPPQESSPPWSSSARALDAGHVLNNTSAVAAHNKMNTLCLMARNLLSLADSLRGILFLTPSTRSVKTPKRVLLRGRATPAGGNGHMRSRWGSDSADCGQKIRRVQASSGGTASG